MTSMSPVVYVLAFIGALSVGSLLVCALVWFAGLTDVSGEYDDGHGRKVSK